MVYFLMTSNEIFLSALRRTIYSNWIWFLCQTCNLIFVFFIYLHTDFICLDMWAAQNKIENDRTMFYITWFRTRSHSSDSSVSSELLLLSSDNWLFASFKAPSAPAVSLLCIASRASFMKSCNG
jgi:hypothetical protein